MTLRACYRDGCGHNDELAKYVPTQCLLHAPKSSLQPFYTHDILLVSISVEFTKSETE